MVDINEETAAVIALALHLCSEATVHDTKEPGVLTFDPVTSDWSLKSLTFRKHPVK